MTFQGEFLALLKKHNVPYDERYLWAHAMGSNVAPLRGSWHVRRALLLGCFDGVTGTVLDFKVAEAVAAAKSTFAMLD